MKSIEFPEANTKLGPPADMTREDCSDLHIYRDGVYCISCWKPTEEEIEEIQSGKPIWLYVHSGGTQTPVALQTKNPFADTINWKLVEGYLQETEKNYREIGDAGLPARLIVISPLRRRFDHGERTERLAKEIMDLR